jgi:hypothetical protein
MPKGLVHCTYLCDGDVYVMDYDIDSFALEWLGDCGGAILLEAILIPGYPDYTLYDVSIDAACTR